MPSSANNTDIYVCVIVPADAELTAEARGQGNVKTRLRGPLAPYDFVATTKAKP